MKIRRLEDVGAEERLNIIARAEVARPEVFSAAREIMSDVRKDGDRAVLHYTEKFDGVKLDRLQVSREEVRDAYTKVGEDVLAAIKLAMNNIEIFHAHQMKLTQAGRAPVETQPGIRIWRVHRPIERVGIYIPGGRAIYPSSVLMNGVPSRLAGCRLRVMCVPPDKAGRVPAPTLVAADLVGIEHIFKIGGAQAIAAMAYGTESVPRTYKIFGAGNSYVTAAKLLAFGEVNIDSPAGPSEAMVIADDSAPARIIASELLAQPEHGPDSVAILLTTSETLAQEVHSEMARQALALTTQATIRASLERHGHIFLVESLEEAVAFANEYAPEHLQITVRNGKALLEGIITSGSVFLGPYSPIPGGDYATGSNHVIPTGGYARAFSALSVDSFSRSMEVQELTREGLQSVRAAIGTLAETEGLVAHKNAIEARFWEVEAGR